ncbi:hypothetical protein KP509_24G079900 [Ceratopteris richardii]|uniref:LIM zinc-binding domain-containing protein n=1 Tax=Ceratopteris richardii TaxID=49495 RepID=A0A8T2RYN3_CERRI|nr:hypothetical protein KP509_24G079900 [Ceratopteris richardii]
MKWLERIFKGASPSRIGEYDTRFEDVGRHNKDSPWDLCGDEDLDRAIALSLAEEEERLSKDEDLARALQESMQLRGRPSHDNSVPVQFVSSRRRVCEGCKKEIGFGRYLSCMDALWHPNCFRCHACNEPITELEFSMVSNCPYHKTCYKKLYHPKCDVCKDFIPANRTGLIEYRAHPFWGQKYCPTHEYDSTPRCCSCERVESKDVQYISLEDKRKLCLECLHTSIMDTGECQPLYHEIRDFFEGMQMKIKQEIPMLLVERQALNEAVESERDGQHHMPETRGLCLSEEQTVNTIFKRPRIVAGNRFIDMRIGPTKLTRHCEVTAILVLYGLPRLLTGSILAHELMHAWLRLNGFRNLLPEVEEGICQVIAHMWLESEVMAGSSNSSSSKKSKAPRTPADKKLGEFFLHQIANDSSPIYGSGFRAGHSSMMQYGLKRTLDHIKYTGRFP